MLRTLAFFTYILLPLRITKPFFSATFLDFLGKLNKRHNDLGRSTYNPKDYKNGNSFQSKHNRLSHAKGVHLQHFLDTYMPKAVVEIGPGSGFFSRQIINIATIKSYTFIEINQSFLNYLKKVVKKENVRASFKGDDYKNIDLRRLDIDCLIAIESLHHMHDRIDFLKKMLEECPNLRCIFLHDPTHYIPRVTRLISKSMIYLKSRSAHNDTSWSTHHFLTIGELESLKKAHPRLLIDYQPIFGPRMKNIVRLLMFLERPLEATTKTYPISRYLSTAMTVTILSG